MEHCSLALQAVYTQPTSPLSGTDLSSLSLSAQPLPECLRLWCPGAVVQMISVVPPQSNCCTFLRCFEDLPLSKLISPSVGCPPKCRFLSPFITPSQECWSCPDSFLFLSLFFPLLFYQLCGVILAILGGLRSSASVQ